MGSMCFGFQFCLPVLNIVHNRRRTCWYATQHQVLRRVAKTKRHGPVVQVPPHVEQCNAHCRKTPRRQPSLPHASVPTQPPATAGYFKDAGSCKSGNHKGPKCALPHSHQKRRQNPALWYRQLHTGRQKNNGRSVPLIRTTRAHAPHHAAIKNVHMAFALFVSQCGADRTD